MRLNKAAKPEGASSMTERKGEKGITFCENVYSPFDNTGPLRCTVQWEERGRIQSFTLSEEHYPGGLFDAEGKESVRE